MLTYADVCGWGAELTYADVCWRLLTYAGGGCGCGWGQELAARRMVVSNAAIKSTLRLCPPDSLPQARMLTLC